MLGQRGPFHRGRFIATTPFELPPFELPVQIEPPAAPAAAGKAEDWEILEDEFRRQGELPLGPSRR